MNRRDADTAITLLDGLGLAARSRFDGPRGYEVIVTGASTATPAVTPRGQAFVTMTQARDFVRRNRPAPPRKAPGRRQQLQEALL